MDAVAEGEVSAGGPIDVDPVRIGNRSGSRFADASTSSTVSPAGITTPPISTSSTGNRRIASGAGPS